MKIDLGSFAFGSSVSSGGNTPSWGTSLGQIKPDLKLTYPGYDNIVIGMVNKSIPVDKVFIPLGKGGHVCNSLEDEGILLAALFDKVYINEIKVNAPFIMLIYKESSDSWAGRKTLKYSVKIEYRRNRNDIVYNSNFIIAAREALHLANNACWVISDMFIMNQDELHMIAGIVNPYESESYATADLRKVAFLEAIKTTYDENPHFKERYSIENINTLLPLPAQNHLEYPLQQIFYGAPGTGKSDTIYETTKNLPQENVYRTTFHPDSDYSTFVGCYKPIMKRQYRYDGKVKAKYYEDDDLAEAKKDDVIIDKVIQYNFIPQAFTNAYIKAWQTKEPVYLIIEEINRGNCAQIFGDLFQLLDRDEDGYSKYPIDADTDLKNYLAEKFAESFRDDIKDEIREGYKLKLPNNLYIWATMNTSDQSLFPIDSAFKRRWDWKYIKIKKGIDKETKKELDWKIKVGEDRYDWWEFLKSINYKIDKMTSSADKQLGYFFCLADGNGNISADTFVNKVAFYLWNDVFKDYAEDGSPLLKYKKEEDKSESDLTFPDFFDESGNVDSNVVKQFIGKVLADDKTDNKAE